MLPEKDNPYASLAVATPPSDPHSSGPMTSRQSVGAAPASYGQPQMPNMDKPDSGPMTSRPAVKSAPTSWGQPQATGAQTSPRTGQTTPPAAMQETGPTATGFVNFGDLYNANAGVASQRAGERQRALVGQAKKASADLSQAQNEFNAGMQKGAAKSPTANDFGVASGTKSGSGEDLAAGRASNGGTAADQSRWGQGVESAMAGYTGPGGLSGSDAYAKLAEETQAAQDAINNPLVGMNATDAALLGAAGQPGFSKLQHTYGDMSGALEKANAASSERAKAAQQESDNALKQYGLLAQQDAATKAANAPAPAGQESEFPNAGGDPSLYNAQGGPGLDDAASWSKLYQDMGLDSNGDGRLNVEEQNEIKDAGGITPADMAHLAYMTPEQRKAWFDKKKKGAGIDY